MFMYQDEIIVTMTMYAMYSYHVQESHVLLLVATRLARLGWLVMLQQLLPLLTHNSYSEKCVTTAQVLNSAP